MSSSKFVVEREVQMTARPAPAFAWLPTDISAENTDKAHRLAKKAGLDDGTYRVACCTFGPFKVGTETFKKTTITVIEQEPKDIAGTVKPDPPKRPKPQPGMQKVSPS